MSAPIETAASKRRRRNRAILVGLATVVVLAVVITVASALAPSKNKSTEPTLTASEQSDLLYKQALDAWQSGDATGAVALATQALDSNSNNADAKTLIVKIKQSGSTQDSGGTKKPAPSTQPTAAATAFDKPIAKFAALLPSSYEGFDVGGVVAGKADADVSGSPLKTGTIFRIAWAIHDRGTKAGAQSFITKSTKALYPKSPASVTVDGATGYFGTDGTQLAAVAYARGRYVFEVALTADGVAPETLKAEALKAAAAFADSPQ